MQVYTFLCFEAAFLFAANTLFQLFWHWAIEPHEVMQVICTLIMAGLFASLVSFYSNYDSIITRWGIKKVEYTQVLYLQV